MKNIFNKIKTAFNSMSADEKAICFMIALFVALFCVYEVIEIMRM